MTKKPDLLFLLLFPIFLTSCIMTKQKVDLMITNALVYTVDEAFSTADCIVVDEGIILATGDQALLLDRFEPAEIFDAGGAFAYPGFYDAHCHFLSYGLNKLQKAELSGTLSFEEVLARVVEHAAKSKAEWVEGRGWDQNDWANKEFPDRTALDSLFPDRPVVLTRIDGHASLVNGEALKRAGITTGTMVQGGEIVLSNGSPTGILIDNAMELVSDVMPDHDHQLLTAALQAAEDDCFAVGLTSVFDAGMDVTTIRLIDSLHRSGQLKMKINAMLNPMDTAYLDFMKMGGYRTDRLHVNSVKLYADGALGSRGACLLEPYSDDPGNHGLIIHPETYYREVIENALAHHYQVNTHAIGDSGNRFILDLYAEYLQGPNDRRWRIEHAQIVHEDDFEKFSKYNIIPSIQSTHATSDMYWAGERIGPERMKGAYAYKRLLELNGWLPNGTDFPIENISPLHTFYAAVARKDLDGYPEEGFQIENALSREEALRSITIWAAKGSFEEEEKGSLLAGKAADIVITDRDLMTIPLEEIPQTRVRCTFVSGEMVYRYGQ
jgi:predicted amidohydrolase YtcJ